MEWYHFFGFKNSRQIPPYCLINTFKLDILGPLLLYGETNFMQET